jgi:sulfur relay (sulfurtransferase) complex TusBCD TusD component (DsrE family)
MDARGLASLPLVEGAQLGSRDLLVQWTLEADKVIVY